MRGILTERGEGGERRVQGTHRESLAMSRNEATRLIETLRKDRSIWAHAPCEHEFRIAESRLFYQSDLPPEGKEWLKDQRQSLADLKKDIADLQRKLTSGFTEKSVQVKLGKTVEKVVPALPGFPYARHDCRAIFDPIDYVAFVGLGEGTVRRVDFLDIKTGNARLSQVQRAIKDAVEDGKVDVKELSP